MDYAYMPLVPQRDQYSFIVQIYINWPTVYWLMVTMFKAKVTLLYLKNNSACFSFTTTSLQCLWHQRHCYFPLMHKLKGLQPMIIFIMDLSDDYFLDVLINYLAYKNYQKSSLVISLSSWWSVQMSSSYYHIKKRKHKTFTFKSLAFLL